jgi:hypothetical protein
VSPRVGFGVLAGILFHFLVSALRAARMRQNVFAGQRYLDIKYTKRR